MQATPKLLRISNNLTQEEVAQLLNISVVQYRKKENGEVRFYANEIFILCERYGIDINMLKGWITNEA
ncbi:cro-repressor [Lysinibacillus phage vB_LspM-01]|nr:cro-repressor [Lysinibacillus phage vB_LspM-01]